MSVDVRFDENGGEYSGWLRITGPISSVRFNDAQPCGLTINGLRIEIDERVTAIHVGDEERTVHESWEYESPSDGEARSATNTPPEDPKPSKQDHGGWRPIDSAPKDGTHVLVYDPRGRLVVALWESRWEQWQSTTGRYPVYPFHWQPLPPAPDEA